MICVSVRGKRRCAIRINIFLMVEKFYSFERCFTLFDLPLYSFTSVSLGVNRSASNPPAMNMAATAKKPRVRKVNFSVEGISLMLQEITTEKGILLSQLTNETTNRRKKCDLECDRCKSDGMWCGSADRRGDPRQVEKREI